MAAKALNGAAIAVVTVATIANNAMCLFVMLIFSKLPSMFPRASQRLLTLYGEEKIFTEADYLKLE